MRKTAPLAPYGNCPVKFTCATTNHVLPTTYNVFQINSYILNMMTAAQLRAARALIGVDQRKLAELSGLSLPTIQRMETSEDLVRGNVDSLTKLVRALENLGLELINEGALSQGGGRGVRLKKSAGVRHDQTDTEEQAKSASLNREGR